MTNYWHDAFVEQLEDGQWAVSRPNEYRNREIFIELGPFDTKGQAAAALDEAAAEYDRNDAIERYHGWLAENARI